MNIKSLLRHPIAFHRSFVDVTGSVTAALFLSQALYWSSRTKDPEGWFYKTIDDWKNETGLTRHEQDTAKSKLSRLGLLEIKKKGVPATLYFRISWDKLEESFSLPESGKLDCRKAANCFAENQQTISENTSENTSETTKKPPTPLLAIPEISLEDYSQPVIDAFNEYISYRKQAKLKAYTPIGAKMQLKMLSKEPDPQECVEYTIRNNYQGLFPYEERNKGGKRPKDEGLAATYNRVMGEIG